jgi:hypothetical protein
MIKLHTFAIIAIAAAVAIPAPARAESPEAEALFREGKKLLKKGQIAEACDKFDASEQIEPKSGTEISLGDCREKNGQLASAWVMFVKAVSTSKQSGNTARAKEAQQRADAVEPRLVYLTIVVPDDSKLEGLVVKRDGKAMTAAQWGQKVPVDPAEYAISAEAPGYDSWTTTVTVKAKSKKVEVPLLDKKPPGKRGEAATETVATGESSTGGPPPPPRSHKLSYGLGIAGVALIGVGIGLGLHANSVENVVEVDCPNPTCGNPESVELNKSARHYALFANIGFAAGGAAIAGAAVLWFIGPGGSSGSRETASIVPILDAGHVGIGYTRSF